MAENSNFLDVNFGFIGLGAMGYPMAMNICKKMSPTKALYITDVSRPAVEKFLAQAMQENWGGLVVIVETAKAVAENAETIFTIVPAASHVRDVYLNPETGVIAAGKSEGRLCVECSTIDLATTRDVGEKIMQAGVAEYVDSPVSGGVPGATEGTLSFLQGCPPASALSARLTAVSLLMASPDKIFPCGPLGSGLAAKISNNYLCGTNLLASAEAMNFGIRNGVDKHILYKVIQNSTGQNFMLDKVTPVPGVNPAAPSSRDYQGGFKAQMMVKDMTLGVEVAEATGVVATMGRAALEVYKQAAVDPRCIDRDVSVIWRFLDGPE